MSSLPHRQLRSTKEQWALLPEMLLNPMAVLFDEKNGTLIYLLSPVEGRAPQLALDVEYYVVNKKDRTQTNSIKSAYQPRLEDIKQRVSRGDLVLIRGGIE